MTTHLHTETSITTLKVLVIVGTRFRTTSDASKAPAIEFASKGRVLALFKGLGEHVGCKFLLFVNLKALAMRKPGNHVIGGFVGNNLHQLNGYRRRGE